MLGPTLQAVMYYEADSSYSCTYNTPVAWVLSAHYRYAMYDATRHWWQTHSHPLQWYIKLHIFLNRNHGLFGFSVGKQCG